MVRKFSLSDLCRPKVTRETLERLNYEQARVLAYVFHVTAAIGCSTIILLYIEFANAEKQFLTIILYLAIICVYASIIHRSRVWLKAPDRAVDAEPYIHFIQRRIIILGCTWGILVTVLSTIAMDQQRCFLFSVCVGLISTAALIATFPIALAYMIPVTIGSFLTLALSYPHADLPEFLCLIGYTILIGFCIYFLNMEIMKRAESYVSLERKNDLIGILLKEFEETASDWLWEIDSKYEIQRVSKRLAQVIGRDQGDVQGKFPEVLIGETYKHEKRGGTSTQKLTRHLEEKTPFRDLIVEAVINAESRIWSLSGKPIFDRMGVFCGYRGVGSDITNAKRSAEQISYLARHDSLTKLANRVLFNDVLNNSCMQCSDHPITIICIDLDDFKRINDTLGHAAGDALLVDVGERIKGFIRLDDLAARLGGDEFAIILSTAEKSEVEAVTKRIMDAIKKPFFIEGKRIDISASCGISRAPHDGMRPVELLRNADLALYRAKFAGPGLYRFYDTTMDARLNQQRALQEDLRHAVDRGELFLNYQPIISFQTGRIVSAEALLRWQHPEHGLVSPTEFISLAEEAGLISSIGRWALKTACDDAKAWPVGVTVTVNMSPIQFKDDDLISSIIDILNSAKLSPQKLEIEITESTLMDANASTITDLRELHSLGIKIALDDFGTGYSSLSYLRQFPFDKVKIDRSFVANLENQQTDNTITRAIIDLAKSLGMAVTAEGIETVYQSELLHSYGTDFGQGYLFSQPISRQAIGEKFTEVFDINDKGRLYTCK